MAKYHVDIRHYDRYISSINTTIATFREHPDIKGTTWRSDLFLAVCGLSGIIVGFPVAQKLGIPCCIVRKEGEPTHGYKIEWFGDGSDPVRPRYWIVDDFVSGGSTVRHIHHEIFKRHPNSELQGVFQYSRNMSAQSARGSGWRTSIEVMQAGVRWIIPLYGSGDW